MYDIINDEAVFHLLKWIIISYMLNYLLVVINLREFHEIYIFFIIKILKCM